METLDNKATSSIPLEVVNKTRIVYLLFFVISAILQSNIPIIVLVVLIALQLFLGAKFHILQKIANLLPMQLHYGEKEESIVLIRFNNLLLLLMLLTGQLLFLFQLMTIYVLLLTFCAILIIVAILGYCLGCRFYYLLKKTGRFNNGSHLTTVKTID